MESVDPDAKLGAGDRLTIVIEEDREPGIPKVVSATGEIEVFPIKGRVKVAGQTTTEAAAEIKRLLEKDYYYSATVKLSLDSRSAQAAKAGSVTISGEVRLVGPLDLLNGERLTVSQAVLKAGGFTAYANQQKVQVTRTEGGKTRQFFINVKEVLDRGAVDKDAVLQDGDRIRVFRNIFTI
jgi:protein involved in polysaccharide export with SLBB domain